MVVQPAILTYPTMVFYFLLGPQVLWNDLQALTNVLKYHTCRSSLRENRKMPITELKWDARTVMDIPGNNAYWFFEFFWLTKGSRNKNSTYILSRDPAHIFLKVFTYSVRHGDRKGVKT